MLDTTEKKIDFFTHAGEELQELVAAIDQDLAFVADLHPDATSCRTLLVTLGDVKHILKVRKISQNLWDDTYFYFEVDALRRVEERHLTGVTHLVKHYKNDRFEAILKTYAEGTPCNRLPESEVLDNPEFIRKLDALYMKLHLAGIAKINFLPRKVVVGPDGELTLVDLSTCIVMMNYGIQRFSQEMLQDSRFINRIERRARRLAKSKR